MNLKYNYFVVLCFALVSFYACNKQEKNPLYDMISTRIVIPKDSMKLISPKSYFRSDSYKYVIYFDSAYCSSCAIKNIPTLNNEIYAWSKYNVDFVIVLREPLNHRELLMRTIDQKIGLSQAVVYYDTTGIFERVNPQLPSQMMYHYFLIDRDDKITVVGDIQKSKGVKELCEKHLRENMLKSLNKSK